MLRAGCTGMTQRDGMGMEGGGVGSGWETHVNHG